MSITAGDLKNKVREIDALIDEKTNADGTFAFDPLRVMISLEMARRLFSYTETGEESGIAIDGLTQS